LKRKDNCT